MNRNITLISKDDAKNYFAGYYSKQKMFPMVDENTIDMNQLNTNAEYDSLKTLIINWKTWKKKTISNIITNSAINDKKVKEMLLFFKNKFMDIRLTDIENKEKRYGHIKYKCDHSKIFFSKEKDSEDIWLYIMCGTRIYCHKLEKDMEILHNIIDISIDSRHTSGVEFTINGIYVLEDFLKLLKKGQNPKVA